MTQFIVVAIAALTMTANAQTNTAATSMTPASGSAVSANETTATTTNNINKKSGKKAQKANAAKKNTKASVEKKDVMATEVTAPVVSSDNPVTAKEEKSMTPADIKATPGVSTATVSTADAAKIWKGTVRAVNDMDSADTQSIQTITTVGASYKASDKLTLKISENFETLNAGHNLPAEQRELISRSNFRAAYTDFAVASSLKGVLGSNDVPVSLVLRKMTGDAVLTQKTSYATADALIDLNVGLPYTLTPKVDLSFDGQVRHVLNDTNPNSTRVLIIPTLSYTINDYLAIYQSAGMMVSLKDNTDFRRNYERLYLATGMGITATKNLTFDLNVSQDKAIYANPGSPFDVTGFTPYQTTFADNKDRTFDAVVYEFVGTYNF